MAPFVKIPFDGKELDAVEVGKRKFLIFVDVSAINVEAMGDVEWPEGWQDVDALFIPVRCRAGKSVQECLQLVEQFEDKSEPREISVPKGKTLGEHLRDTDIAFLGTLQK